MNDLFGFAVCVCPVCKQEFERLSIDWAYRIRRGNRVYYYCSYSHWVEALDSCKKAKVKRTVSRLSDEQKEIMFRMLDAGKTPREISKALNVTDQCVIYYRKKRP